MIPKKKSPNSIRSGALLVYGAGTNQVPVLEACRREGWRVIAIDQNRTAPGVELADRFLNLSVRDHEAITTELSDEMVVGVIARITDHVGLVSSCRFARNRGLASPCDDLWEAATSKASLARHCERAGLLTPQRYETSDSIPFDKGPVILRPEVTIRGKAGVYRVDSKRSLESVLAKTISHSGSGKVDISAWIPGVDISVLAQLQNGQARRIALWDEWVGIDDAGTIRGFGCGMPSIFQEDTAAIDEVLDRLASAFPASQVLIALSLRIDSSGRPWVIEITLGLGGDGIADLLLPEALPGLDVFGLWARVQLGESMEKTSGACRPRAVIRKDLEWALVEAGDAKTLREICLASLPTDWEVPLALLGKTAS